MTDGGGDDRRRGGTRGTGGAREMIMYAWEVLPGDPAALPVMTGVTADQDQAREHAGAVLARDGQAFLARVEMVRPSLGRPLEYQRTGRAWLGRRTRDGGVHWAARHRPQAPGRGGQRGE